MIDIINNVPVPRMARPRKAPRHIRMAINNYREAYFKVYKTHPKVEVQEDNWIKVEHKTNRVKLKRLKEMTQMLRFRGED